MTAALTIGPDGVGRIEILLKLDIVLRTEEVARAAGNRDRVLADDQRGRDGRHGAGGQLPPDGVEPGSRPDGGSAAAGGADPAEGVALVVVAEAGDAVPAAPHLVDGAPAVPTVLAQDPHEEPPTVEDGQRSIDRWLEPIAYDFDSGDALPPRIHFEADDPVAVDDLADIIEAVGEEPAPASDSQGGDDVAVTDEAITAGAETDVPSDRTDAGGDAPAPPAPTPKARAPRQKRAPAPKPPAARPAAPAAPPRPIRPPPPLTRKPSRTLTAAEVEAARSAGRFQRLPAIDERLGDVPLIETVDQAKAALVGLGHKVREIARNVIKVDARQFDRTSFLAYARSAVRMDAARKKGLVAV